MGHRSAGNKALEKPAETCLSESRNQRLEIPGQKEK